MNQDTRQSPYCLVFWLLLLGALTVPAAPAGATPPFTLLHSFSGLNGDSDNSDGESPLYGALVQGSDGDFYGTAAGGGPFGNGTVFKITSSGVLTTLAAFNGLNGSGPRGGLVLGSDGNFYGITGGGGSAWDPSTSQYGVGTIFKVTPSGTLTTLHDFSSDSTGMNSDGASLIAGLVEGSDGDFYGTAPNGGSSNTGTVFKITSTGTFTTLHSFSAFNSNDMNGDGAYPDAGLVEGNDGNFYGMTSIGGTSGGGIVFKITPAGVLTPLVNFTGANGSYPFADLIRGSDGNFYGTTTNGGTYFGDGTVFKMVTDGTQAGTTLTTLAVFDVADGQSPEAPLIQGRDGNFYGTTVQGGSMNGGTVFKMVTDGTQAGTTLTTLVSFAGANGRAPIGGLVLGSDGNFYGTTSAGGGSYDPANYQQGNGTIFQLATGSQRVYSFSATDSNGDNSDGANPEFGNLVAGADGDFYGTTLNGGSSGDGTIFKVTASGVQTTIVDFNRTNGAFPNGPLAVGNDGDFYGTTYAGGSSNVGTVFKATPAGSLTTLVSFNFANGQNPTTGLVQASDGNFYGTTYEAGQFGAGTVFKITPSGTLTTLVSLNPANGAFPGGPLIQGSDGSLYGTAQYGGEWEEGVVFKVTLAGTFTTLLSFNRLDGATPQAGLIEGGDGNYYGTTALGGSFGDGTIFKITPTGTLTTLTSFDGVNGASPEAVLVRGSDGDFYGTTYAGGSDDLGTAFKVTLSGALTTLANFDDSLGANPYAGLTASNDGSFYGTTSAGGANGTGAIYRLAGPEQGSAKSIVMPENTQISFPITFDDPSGLGIDNISFAAEPAFGTVALVPGSLTENGVAGSVDVVYTPNRGYYGSDTFTYTVNGYAGTSLPSPVLLQIIPTPVITSFSPARGSAGTVVTIVGMHLNGASAVSFNGTFATVFSVNAAGTQITATVPVGATSGGIVVGTSGGNAATPSAFTIVPPPPTIASFIPATGGPGTLVTVTGTNLTGATVVGFQNAHASSFTVNWAGTQITTTVPTGASTGQIAVLTPGGETKSAAAFTVPPAPALVSFTPTSGAAGTTVTISGTNLTGTIVVGFQSQHAKTFAVNAAGTQITTTVPSGAMSGPLAVLTNGIEAKSATSFTVIP